MLGLQECQMLAMGRLVLVAGAMQVGVYSCHMQLASSGSRCQVPGATRHVPGARRQEPSVRCYMPGARPIGAGGR
jgi:hypothetical protein